VPSGPGTGETPWAFFCDRTLEPGTTMFVTMLGSGKRYSNPYIGWDMPLGPQEAKAARISRQSAYEGGKVVSLMQLMLPSPHRRDSWYSFVLRGWVDPRASVWLEGQWKIPVTLLGIEMATFWLCSAVPQPTVPPCTLLEVGLLHFVLQEQECIFNQK
jgi:hypothetical protein